MDLEKYIYQAISWDGNLFTDINVRVRAEKDRDEV